MEKHLAKEITESIKQKDNKRINKLLTELNKLLDEEFKIKEDTSKEELIALLNKIIEKPEHVPPEDMYERSLFYYENQLKRNGIPISTKVIEEFKTSLKTIE